VAKKTPRKSGVQMGNALVIYPQFAQWRLPVKNYTTNVISMTEEELTTFKPEYLRAHYEITPNPCWACRMHHHHIMRIADGDYAGCVVRTGVRRARSHGLADRVYDGLAATMLSAEADRLGLEVNEAGWSSALLWSAMKRACWASMIPVT